jgi:hypothetical protein
MRDMQRESMRFSLPIEEEKEEDDKARELFL